MPYQPTCAMVQSTPQSAIPNDFDVVPTVITYEYSNQVTLPVHVRNVTTRTITAKSYPVMKMKDDMFVKYFNSTTDGQQRHDYENER